MLKIKNKRFSLIHGDIGIWIVFFFLCVISLVEVFSASSTLSFKNHNYMGPIGYHALMIGLGIVACIVATAIPCKYYKLLTPWLLLISFVTLIGVYIWGQSINGANRIITILGVSFQPSEIAKGSMILATAQILSATQREDGKGADSSAMPFILWLLFPMLALIGVENLSTAALLFVVIFTMMFIGRVPLPQLGKLLGFVILAVASVFFIANKLFEETDDQKDKQTTTAMAQTNPADKSADGDKEEEEDEGFIKGVFHRFLTWKNRVISHYESEKVEPEIYDYDGNFQVAHAHFAICKAGPLGSGPGNSVERDVLPQAFSDFIYAIIIEETGLLGGAFTALLYIILLLRCRSIAKRCENNFPAFLIIGLTIMLVTQAVMNMMVAVGLMPVTGQPLPLISKGGTSTIISCAYIGAILSVSRWAKQRETANSLNTL